VTDGSIRVRNSRASRFRRNLVHAVGDCHGLDLIGDSLAHGGEVLLAGLEFRRSSSEESRGTIHRIRSDRVPLSSSQMHASIAVFPAPTMTY
jgi:hypothetical protein